MQKINLTKNENTVQDSILEKSEKRVLDGVFTRPTASQTRKVNPCESA